MAATIQEGQDFARLLGTERARARLGKYAWRIGLPLLLLLLLAQYASWKPQNFKGPLYTTETVVRGNLHIAVTATGNLQPTNKVDVGSELSGLVESVLVQENAHVKKGQVLARLDTLKLNAQVTQSKANLASAQAKLAQAEATVKESSASFERLQEVSRLSGGKVPSKTEMETAEASLTRAKADASNCRAVIDQTRAQLSSDEVNLYKASIRSPIEGVILARSVEPGQAVAASLQVATLFTIAEDLRKMELKVDVDEADVGDVKHGQIATFTVDAYPNRTYSANVKRVAFGSQTKDNVVSYSTVLVVNNSDLSLRPGMTATAEIATASKDGVLLIPNSALRFTPPAVVAQQQDRGLIGTFMPRPPSAESSHSTATQTKGSSQQVWTLQAGRPFAVALTIGATDGKFTEVTGGDVKEGMQVITDSVAAPK